ncbi:MAG: hypothetical protein ACRDCW_00900, partial [Sarcina sp.]
KLINKELIALDRIDKQIKEYLREIDFINMIAYEEIWKVENDEKLILRREENAKIKFEKIYLKNKKIYEILLENLSILQKELKNE